jgi:hypothetical protein
MPIELELTHVDSIPLLKTSEQWKSWDTQIHHSLIMLGYGRLFDTEMNPPLKLEDETRFSYEERRAHWEDLQERACAAVRSRLHPAVAEKIGESFQVNIVLDMIKRVMMPRAAYSFDVLMDELDNLQLKDFSSVGSYAHEFKRIQGELSLISTECRLPEPHLARKFLNGLGSNYGLWKLAFLQTRSPVAMAADESHREFKPFTLEEAIDAASKEESQLAIYKGSKGQILGGDKILLASDYCSRCRKVGHIPEDCWVLHPHLKRSRNSYRRPLQTKRRRIEFEEDVFSEEAPLHITM